MLGASGLRRDAREDGGNAAAYNQLFDGSRSCFHDERSSTGGSERWRRPGGWDHVQIIQEGGGVKRISERGGEINAVLELDFIDFRLFATS